MSPPVLRSAPQPALAMNANSSTVSGSRRGTGRRAGRRKDGRMEGWTMNGCMRGADRPAIQPSTHPFMRFTSHRAVIAEPCLHPRPALLRCLLVVARAIVGVKAVLRIGKNNDLARNPGRFQRRPHLLDGFGGNPRVLAAVQTKDR